MFFSLVAYCRRLVLASAGGYKRAFVNAKRPTLYIGYALLGLAIIGLIIYLREAEKPWEKGVEARVASGRNIKVEHHVISGLWYASWINVILCALLVLVLPYLTQPLRLFQRAKAGVSPKSRPAFLIFGGLAIGLAVTISVPRLDSSLWGDEEYTLRRSIIGEYERDKEDDITKLDPLTWEETMWNYRKPNNHILNSVLSRLSHETFFRQSGDPGQLYFSETIVRMPAFLAALGAIIATGYALACLGFIRAGVLAMFILPLHPWFIRYGTETRGYAFVFLFAALSMVFLIKAIRRGRWRYWIAYGLCEFLIFIAYPGTFYFLVTINLSGLALAVLTSDGWQNRFIQAGRFAIVNVIAGMLVVQTMAPCFGQLKIYFAKDDGKHFEDFTWMVDNFSYIVSGMTWLPWDAENDLCNSLSQRPALGWLFMLVIAAALIAGIVRLYRTSLQTRILLCLFLLQWPLLTGISHLQGNLLYHWYSLGALVPTVMLIAIGVEWLSRAKFWQGAPRFAPIGSVAFLCLFIVVTAPQVRDLRAHSVEPLKESVEASRNVLNPEHPDIDQVYTIGFHQAARCYDAAMHYIRRSDPPGSFEAILAKSTADGKALYVNLAMPALARREFPEIMAIINDPAQFRLHKEIPGMAAHTTRYVYLYIGGEQ